MSPRKSHSFFRRSANHALQALKLATKRIRRGLLRNWLQMGRSSSSGVAGFVLPTTVLLVLVVLLTVGSIAYRTYTRTTQTISDRQQRVVYNTATPAIDRAKAKLEFLLDESRDTRLPGGVPAETYLLGMLLNRDGGTDLGGLIVPPLRINGGADDPYVFAGETRVNVGASFAGDTGADNAWKYEADTSGDGQNDATVVYSISLITDAAALADTSDERVQDRAARLQVRNGPLSNAAPDNPLCAIDTAAGASAPQEGWIPDQASTSILRKNFQVDVLVIPYTLNRPVTTLEVQQDRQIDRGNKWGAWFRNDLEVFPGPQFNFNGAMHTEGSFFGGNSQFRSYLLSSPASCLTTDEGSESEISVTERSDPPYRGQFIAAFMTDNDFANGNDTRYHIPPERWQDGNFNGEANANRLRPANDSVDPPAGVTPEDYALDPVRLFTEDESVARGFANAAQQAARTANWDNRQLVLNNQGRLRTQQEEAPYVDDSYRADNRYGPKPRYNNAISLADVGDGTSRSLGQPIAAADPSSAQLTTVNPPAGGDASGVGLDGYWERRARAEGVRIVVGQRLELGDPAGWGGPLPALDDVGLLREPLRPFNSCTENYDSRNLNAANNNRCNESRQRRTLWDNLAAVQATVIYHSASGNPDVPLACLATTVHPGTAETLDRSSTFENLAYGFESALTGGFGTAQRRLISDFFNGRGTNGWEYEFNTAWISQYSNSNSAIRVALQNLANLAGDPRGGAPSFPPVQDGTVHPYPATSMYGDFSMLRRVLGLLNSGVSYANLSPADKSTLHTSSCMMGMLGHNIAYLNNFTLANVPVALRGRTNIPAGERYEGLRGIIRAFREGVTPLGEIRIPDPETGPVGNAPPPGQVGQPTPNAFERSVRAFVNQPARRDEINRDLMSSPVGFFDPANPNRWGPSQPQIYVRLIQRLRDVAADNGGTVDVGAGVNLKTYTVEQLNQILSLAQFIITREQVSRDRIYGFRGSGASANGSAEIFNIPGGALYSCPSFAQNAATPGADDPLYALCSVRPRYPTLYNLFPVLPGGIGSTHGETFYAAGTPPAIAAQPGLSRDDIDARDNYLQTVNGGAVYVHITPGSIAVAPRSLVTNFVTPANNIILPGNFTANTNRDNRVKACVIIVCSRDTQGPGFATVGNYWRVALKDTALLNGREMMSLRALNVHLNIMRNTSIGGQRWLPDSGVMYAFREDSMSELGTVRPSSGGTWAACGTEQALRTTANCRMNTAGSAYASTDPPLNAANAISPKPVDYHGDPDRRAHGFRLTKGPELVRPNDNGRGLSFISDNAVYVQGDFNLHRTAGDIPLEEFQGVLDPAWPEAQFYTRNQLDNRFARRNTDRWRPSEILADGIHIISDNFCDGSIEDAFLVAGDLAPNTANLGVLTNDAWGRYGCTIDNIPAAWRNVTSYLSLNRMNSTAVIPRSTVHQQPIGRWMRANIGDSVLFARGMPNGQQFMEGSSPLVFTPNGNPVRARIFTNTAWDNLLIQNNAAGVTPGGNPAKVQYVYDGGYLNFGQARTNLLARPNNRVNAIIVSGIVPSRARQSYGGLHNFPRFLERWNTVQAGGGDNPVPLFMSGSLLQLSFSQQATGPFDQDAWEVGANTAPGETQGYYSPPLRRWGYDVGLQYAPAGPVAQRFVVRSRRRSEFYNEPPANDPYMSNLCTAVVSNPSAGVTYGGRTCPT
ncbi:MAG: hormogonium polysaccharide biosynthesis protein HpsA [Kaiparowitsia implicata GSE-PSE-MK54-09C]|jgi:hypothetical protein|nr:hormogonium polysaccharide biosynthesis protein HpsA [Kaiparowitsia implicata GSE-PSE-MK54-09C]